jgi:uncharacterized protein YjiS (DUF1127 family)
MFSLSLRRSSSTAPHAPAMARRVAKWIETRRTRAALAQLDAHMLRDIGLDSNMAEREAHRPFWQE